MSWEIYDSLDEIKEKVRAFIEKFSRETIASITGWDYIRSALATVVGFWRSSIKSILKIRFAYYNNRKRVRSLPIPTARSSTSFASYVAPCDLLRVENVSNIFKHQIANTQFMEPLSNERCVACHPNSTRVTAYEIVQLKPQVPDWNLIEKNGVPQIERTYEFPDFKSAIAFTNSVGEVAETEGHHPALLTEWGKVTVTWWTHAISGLHRNDFIMAAKTDAIANQFST